MINEVTTLVYTFAGLFALYFVLILNKIIHTIKSICRLDVDALPENGIFPKFDKDKAKSRKKLDNSSSQENLIEQFDLAETLKRA